MLTTHVLTARALDRDRRAIADFWRLVVRPTSPESCWEWSRELREESPTMPVAKRRVQVSRVAWCAVTGEYPLATNCLHSCGNRQCVRPSHMAWLIGRRAALDIELLSSGYGGRGERLVVTAEEEMAAERSGGPER